MNYTFLAASFLLVTATAAEARETPQLTPLSQPKSGVPVGKVQSFTLKDSKIFPGTTRDWSIYIPAQYDASKPAAVMVFLDGRGYQKPDGAFRATIVLDNLIAAGKMPVTVAIFVDPGTIPATSPGAKPRSTRSFEYDTPSASCAEFLATEILPEAKKLANLSADPNQWGICGISSSAIAAFTAAWERPEMFRKVISHIGSFTNIRGGYHYPAMIRASKKSPKPIRIWMQDGESDLDNLHGQWPLANEDMSKALVWAGYDHQFTLTGGGHSGQAGGALLPEALTWLWRDHNKAPEPPPAATAEAPKDTTKGKRHPDSDAKPGVAQGTHTDMGLFKSNTFPNTERQWWVYTSASYKPDGKAAVMIFQDGHDYQKRDGSWSVPNVIDNLTAKGDLPPMVAVFINPGHDPAKEKKNPWSSSNRSLEYDGQGDRYAKFLLEEILPAVEAKWPVSKDPELQALCGASSGGICAFNAAWERPDAFRKVLSTIGSFVNLRGGERLSYDVRKTERKPLRVFLQDSTGDLDNPFGHWPTANRQMHASLEYMGYDVKFDFAEGYGHNSTRGGEIFPDAMRWLWRKDKPTLNPGKTKDDLAGDMTLNKILVPGTGWQEAASGLGFADGLSSDATGAVFYNDLKLGGLWKLAPDGSKTKLSEENGSGAKLGTDGRWYFCQGKAKRLVAMDAQGKIDILAENVQPNDLVVTAQGWVYFTHTGKGEVVGINAKTKELKVAASGLAAPNGIGLSPDHGTLAVSEYKGGSVWAYRINPDGSLDAGMPYMTLRRPIDDKAEAAFAQPPPFKAASGGDGLCADAQGRWFVTSSLGVQVFDATGRECGLLPLSGNAAVSVTIDAAKGEWLYAAQGDKIWKRKLQH